MTKSKSGEQLLQCARKHGQGMVSATHAAMVLCVAATVLQGQASHEKPVKAVVVRTLEQVSLLWLDGYRSSKPGAALEVVTEDAGPAALAFSEGQADFILMSRELKPEEAARFSARKGYAPTRIAVAMDALVVLVHAANPIRELRLEQLDAIYTSTRFQGWPKDVSRWGDLGLTQADWLNRAVVPWSAPSDSGARTLFMEAVTLGGITRKSVKKTQEDAYMHEELTRDLGSIGYGSMGDVLDSLRLVPIVPAGSNTPIPPSRQTVSKGSYPLTWFHCAYVDKAPDAPLPVHVTGYLRFALSAEGQKLLELNGQVPLPDALLQQYRRRLE